MKRALLLLSITFALITTNSFGQWSQTTGPKGMNVTEFYQKGTILFCGTSSHGAYKSNDHGVTWSVANNGIQNLSVFTLTSDDLYLYAGTNDGSYRSSDNGATWSPANTGMEGKFIYSYFQNAGFLFAGTIGFGLFKSNDHGNTWTDANGGALGSSSIYAMCFSSPNLIVEADNLVFYSTDNGNSWFIPGSSPFTFNITQCFVVNGDSVLLNGGFCVFRSFDAGVTWGSQIIIEDGINVSGMMKIGNKVVAGCSTGIFFSKNFGGTWQHVNGTGLRGGTRFQNHFYRSGNNFLLSFDELGVAYSSNKGSTWNYSLTGFEPASTVDNSLFVSGTTVVAGTHSDGVYRTSNDGTTWTKIGTGNDFDTLSNGIVFAIYQSGSIIFAGVCGEGLYRSADNGVTWAHITAGLPNVDFLCIESITKSGTKYIMGTDRGIYYSSDNGLTWNNSNITGVTYFASGLAANGTTAIAVVDRTTGNNEIYRSTNSGVTWNVVFSSLDDFISAASDGSTHFYAGSFGNNYVSSNNGMTWSSFGPGITGSGAFTIAARDNFVFVGNNSGVFFSDDFAASFSQENTGLDPDPNMSVQGLAISDTYVFAGLFQNAVWKRPVSDFGIVFRENIVEQKELNLIIAPNPASSFTTLEISNLNEGEVLLDIFDVNGRLISHQKLSADINGLLNYEIDLSGMNSGNYFAKITQGNNSKSVNFSVVK